MNEDEFKRLKRDIISRLGRKAKEHPMGHQGIYANRYVMRSFCGVQIELMFEKDDRFLPNKTPPPPNLWVKKDFVQRILQDRPRSMPLIYTESPKSKLYKTTGPNGKPNYGRHSALEKMPQLGNADLICFNVRSMDQLEYILKALCRVKMRRCLWRILCSIFRFRSAKHCRTEARQDTAPPR